MKFFTLFLLIIFFISCKDQQPQSSVVVEKSELRIEKKHQQVISLEKNVSKKIDNWLEYETLKNFLKQFDSISPNEALNNSKELNDLVTSVRDSVKPKFLQSPAFDARINLLHNETLRLYDMSSIPAIKFKEVNNQVEKLLEAFSAINSKINTIVRQTELDSQVSDSKFNRMVSKDTIIEKKEPTKKELADKRRNEKMKLSKEQRLKNRNEKFKKVKKPTLGKKKDN